MRLFLSLSEEDMQKFDRACEKAGMKRSQYFKYLLSGRRDIRPPVLQYRELIHVLGNIERDLKVIAMKEELADKDRIFIMQKLADLNDTFAGRFEMEIKDKEYTMDEIVKLVNEQVGEFIININLEEDNDNSKRSL